MGGREDDLNLMKDLETLHHLDTIPTLKKNKKMKSYLGLRNQDRRIFYSGEYLCNNPHLKKINKLKVDLIF